MVPTKLKHKDFKSQEANEWVGKPKTCPACLSVGIIGVQFGLRRMKPNEPQVPQSWCRACRKEERVIRAGAPELSRDDVIELIRKHKRNSHVEPVEPVEVKSEPVKPAKPKRQVKPKTAKTGKVVITPNRAELAAIYDEHCPGAFKNFPGDKLAWKNLFKCVRTALAGNFELSPKVLDMPEYQEILAEDSDALAGF